MKTHTQNLSTSNTHQSYSSLAEGHVKNEPGKRCSDQRRKALSTLTARVKKANKPKTVEYDFVGIAG